jgi:predicted DCC family thiol-disulfide oxidoreductase YuxK
MPRDTCYYDGQCGLCRWTVDWLRRLDWLGRLEFEDMTRTEDLPVRLEDAMRGLPMQTRDGRVLIGYPAIRRALVQTPLGILVAWAMYLPGIDQIGRWVYRRIADHRGRDVACAAPAGAARTPRGRDR